MAGSNLSLFILPSTLPLHYEEQTASPWYKPHFFVKSWKDNEKPTLNELSSHFLFTLSERIVSLIGRWASTFSNALHGRSSREMSWNRSIFLITTWKTMFSALNGYSYVGAYIFASKIIYLHLHYLLLPFSFTFTLLMIFAFPHPFSNSLGTYKHVLDRPHSTPERTVNLTNHFLK